MFSIGEGLYLFSAGIIIGFFLCGSIDWNNDNFGKDK